MSEALSGRDVYYSLYHRARTAALWHLKVTGFWVTSAELRALQALGPGYPSLHVFPSGRVTFRGLPVGEK